MNSRFIEPDKDDFVRILRGLADQIENGEIKPFILQLNHEEFHSELKFMFSRSKNSSPEFDKK